MKQQQLTCAVLMFLSKFDAEDESVENKSDDNGHHNLLEKKMEKFQLHKSYFKSSAFQEELNL